MLNLRIKFKKLCSRLQNTNVVFLHVGKTAGTSLRSFIWSTSIPFRYNVHFPTHGEVPVFDVDNTFYFINVRDPFDRIQSGFNSRLRQGLPAYNNPWSEEERSFYEKYPTFIYFVQQCMIDKSLYSRFQMHNVHCRYGYAHYLAEIQNLGLVNKIRQVNFETCQQDIALVLKEANNPPSLHMHKSSDKLVRPPLTLRNSFTNKFLIDEYNAIKLLQNEH